MADNRVTITLDAAGSEAVARVFADLAAKGQQFAKNITAGAKEADRAVSGLGSTARTVFEIFTGVSLGNIFVQVLQGIKDTTIELVKLGHEARRQEESFRLVAESIGVSSSALEEGLRKASDGLVNASDIMLTASRGLQNSLKPDQLVALMEVARAQAKLAGKDVTTAFNDIATAATNQTARQLKAYGIIIDTTKANKDFADSLGVSEKALTEAGKTQAFTNAIIAEMKGKLVDSSSEILKQEEALDRWKVAWQELKESVGKNIVAMANETASNVGSMTKWVEEQVKWLQEWTKWMDLSATATGHLAAAQREAVARRPELRAVGEGGMGGAATVDQINRTKQFGAAVQDTSAFVDKLAAALAALDEGLALLQAKLNAGKITSDEFAKSLEKQLVTFQGLAKGSHEAQLKYLGLEAALRKVNETMMSEVVGAFKSLGQALESAGLDDFEKGLLQVNRAIDANVLLTDAQRKTFKAVAADMAMTTLQLESQKKVLQEDARLWNDLNAAIELSRQELKITGDTEAALTKQIEATTQALIEARSKYGDNSEAAIDFANRLKVLTKELDAVRASQKALTDAMILLDAQIEAQGANAKESVDAWNALARAEQDAAQMAQVVGVAYDAASAKIDLQQREIALLVKEYGALSPQVRAAVDELQKLQAIKFGEELAAINVQSKLLGDTFDATGEAISRWQARFKELAAAAKGEVTPAMIEAADTIKRLTEQQKIEQMVKSFTNGFDQALAVVRSFLDTARSGLSDFFQLVGRGLTGQVKSWKDFADAVRGIWTNMLNSILRALSDWLASTIVRQFLGVISAAGSGGVTVGGGTGGVGGVGGGAGAIGALGSAGAGGGGSSFQSIIGLTQNLGSATSAVNSFGEAVGILGTNLFDLASGALGFASEAATLGPAFGGAVTLGPAATGVTTVDMFAAGASIGQVTQALQAAQPAISGFGTLLAGVGAALSVFSGIMALVNGQMATGIGTLSGVAVGAVAGAVVGSIFPGIGTLVGALAGAGLGGALGGLIGGLFEDIPTHYEIVRQNAQAIANAGIAAVVSKYEAAAKSQSPAEVQAALAGRAGQVYTLLQLPEQIATAMGIAGEKIAENKIQVEWSALTLDQFTRLLDLFKANPALAQTSVMGSADVPYLAGGDAATNAGRIKDASLALIAAFNAIGSYIKDVNELTGNLSLVARLALPEDVAGSIQSGLIEPLKAGMLALLDATLTTEELTAALDKFEQQAQDIGELIKFTAESLAQNRQIRETATIALPPDLAADLIANVLDPMRQAMVDALSSGFDPAVIQQRMEEIQQEQAALGGLVSAYATIDEEIAGLSGDLDAITNRAIAGATASARILDENVTTAMTNLANAAGDISMEEELALIDAAHAAVMARYDAEMKAIAAIEQQIATTLKTYADPLNALTTSIGLFQIANQGSVSELGGLITSMTTLALTSQSSSEALWATQQALAAIVTTGGALASSVGKSMTLDAGDPAFAAIGTIVQAMADQLAPILAKLQADATAALESGNLTGALDKLNQMAAAATSVAQGAIAAVNAWADAARDAVNKLADAQIKAITETAKAQTDALEVELKGIENKRKANDAELKSLNRRIDAIQKAAEKTIQANELEIEGLNDRIADIQKKADAETKANDKLIKGLDAQIAAIEKIADAQVKANEITIRGLEASIKAIETEAKTKIAANDASIKMLQKEVALAQKRAEAEMRLNDAAARRLDKEIAGIQKVADAETKANSLKIAGLNKEMRDLQRIADARLKANDDALEILDDQMKAIQTIADAQRDANDREIDALRARQDALQDAVETAREWGRVLDSVKKQITDLLLGPQAPLNPLAQLDIARDAYERALANATTPEGVTAAQAAAQDYLRAAGGVFARPSMQYQAIFNEVLAALGGLEGTAASGAGAGTDALEAELAAVTEQLKALEAANKALEQATRDQLAPLQAQADALKESSETIRDALEEQLEPMKLQVEALEELNDTIRADAEARIEPLREQSDALKELNQTLRDALEAEIGPRQEEIERLQELNEGLRYWADTMTEPLRNNVDALRALNDAIKEDAELRIAPLKEQVESLRALNAGIKELADEQIEPLKERVSDLTQANRDLKRSTDELLQPLKDQVTALNDANDALDDDAAAIREHITAINADRDARIAAVEADRKVLLEGIDATAKFQTQEITSSLNTTLIGIRDQQTPILADIRAHEDAIRAAVTNGNPTDVAIAIATQAAAADLALIKGDLHAFLVAAAANPSGTAPATTSPTTGAGPSGIVPTAPPNPTGEMLSAAVEQWWAQVWADNVLHPGQSWAALAAKFSAAIPSMRVYEAQALATRFAMTLSDFTNAIHVGNPNWMPSAQTGVWRTKEGPYYLHADERVLPKAQADVSRASGGGGVTLNISVSVAGSGDEELIKRAVRAAVAETETSARIGRLNRIIQEQVR